MRTILMDAGSGTELSVAPGIARLLALVLL
jgi:hypothetical protein